MISCLISIYSFYIIIILYVVASILACGTKPDVNAKKSGRFFYTDQSNKLRLLTCYIATTEYPSRSIVVLAQVYGRQKESYQIFIYVTFIGHTPFALILLATSIATLSGTKSCSVHVYEFVSTCMQFFYGDAIKGHSYFIL